MQLCLKTSTNTHIAITPVPGSLHCYLILTTHIIWILDWRSRQLSNIAIKILLSEDDKDTAITHRRELEELYFILFKGFGVVLSE
jgi:hypothetical protein